MGTSLSVDRTGSSAILDLIGGQKIHHVSWETHVISTGPFSIAHCNKLPEGIDASSTADLWYIHDHYGMNLPTMFNDQMGPCPGRADFRLDLLCAAAWPNGTVVSSGAWFQRQGFRHLLEVVGDIGHFGGIILHRGPPPRVFM